MNSSKSAGRIYMAGLMVGCLPILTYWLLPGFLIHSHHAFMLGYGAAFIPFMCVYRGVNLIGRCTQTFWCIILFSLLARLILLLVPPLLSEDLWRYIWDGSIQWAGQNPYQYAPSDPRLDFISQSNGLDFVRSQIGHAHIPTIYPPFAQFSFIIATTFEPSQLLMRLTAILGDVVIVATLWFWAKKRDVHPGISLLYGFLPLSVVESSVGGHIDSIGVAALVYGLYLWDTKKPWSSGFFIWCAAGAKLVPLLVLLPMWKQKPNRAWRVTLIFALLTIVTFLIYETYPKGLITFAQKWRGNEGLFAVISWILESQCGDFLHSLRSSQYVGHFLIPLVGSSEENAILLSAHEAAFAVTKVFVLVILVAVGTYAFLKVECMASFWIIFMGALLLVSPMVHPWYLLWIMPFVFLVYPKKHLVTSACIYWSLSMWLTYWPRPNYLESGVWDAIEWVPFLVYIPVFICLFLAAEKEIRAGYIRRAANKNS